MFQFPIFLWAAAAATIPLILHMMQRRRIVRVPFSTIRFLLLAQKRSSRRVHLENLLLWLLRTLLMLLIAVAFAVPMIRTRAFGNYLSRAERDVAIVIDTSYSMNYSAGRETVWDRAVQAALAIVDGLDDGDRICVYAAADTVKPIVEQLTQDKDYVTTQLRALQPTTTESQLAPATIAAYDALKQEERRREREIHIITDGQALPWSDFAGAARDAALEEDDADSGNADEASAEEDRPAAVSIDPWQPQNIDRQTAIFVTLVGVPEPENVAPLDVDLQPQLIMADMPSKVRVRLGYSGAVEDSTVTIRVDDEEIATRAFNIESDEAGALLFTVPPLSAGIHRAEAVLPDDNLAVDNTFHFLIRVKEKLPSLCVGTQEDTFFLMKALTARTDSGSAIDVHRIEADTLPREELSDYTSLFLCNALPLPGQVLFAIEQFVRAGGLLVLFPGDRAAIRDYEPWSCLPGQPANVALVPIGDRKRILRWTDLRHPLIRGLRLGPGDTPVVTVRRELVWTETAEETVPLIFAGAQRPFLLSRPFGDGAVLMFSLAADRSWSNFPLSPFYLPLMHQTVHYGAGISEQKLFLRVTRRLALKDVLPQASQQTELSGPAHEAVPIHSAIVDGKTTLYAEDLMQPGVYEATDGPSAEAEPAFAIDLPTAESNLAVIEKKEIPDTLGVRGTVVAEGKEEMLKLIEEHRIGRTFAEQILWLAFLLAIVEVIYANRKAKAGSPLSQTLGVEPSGKVRVKHVE